MFGSTRSGANAYASVGVETGVVAASPHKLVVMLFEGAMAAVASGIQHMQSGDIANKGMAISKAITIIDCGLRASLDKKVGGEIALNLDALYEYMSNSLVIANLKNQTQPLEEVYQLLKGLKDSWESIDSTATNADRSEQSSAPNAPAYDALSPHVTSRLAKA